MGSAGELDLMLGEESVYFRRQVDLRRVLCDVANLGERVIDGGLQGRGIDRRKHEARDRGASAEYSRNGYHGGQRAQSVACALCVKSGLRSHSRPELTRRRRIGE